MQNECSLQIERVCEALLVDGAVDADELVALARYAAGNLPGDSRLSPCADLDALPEASFQRLDAWRALAALLLTNEGKLAHKIQQAGRFSVICRCRSIQAAHRCADRRVAIKRSATTSVAWAA